MTAKLRIDLSQGIIDVEGDAELVRQIYSDFKVQLLSEAKLSPRTQTSVEGNNAVEIKDVDTDINAKRRVKKRVAAKKRPSGAEDAGLSLDANSPKLDKNLDLSNLPTFYQQYEPKNNPEKILIFLKFMLDNLQIENPNTDQFYTCYEKVNERVPKVFSQAFRDTAGRKFGFIDYNSPTDIRLTTVGSNHFKFDLKKKTPE